MGDVFDIIVADPPWAFASNSKARPGRNAMRHYPCMTDAEIAGLRIDRRAATDALLFLWTTAPMLERSMRIVADHWNGFRYKTNLVWDKEICGTGFYARNEHEIVLVYRRGKFPIPRPAPFQSSIIRARRRQHSQKPDDLQDVIDRTWPNASRLEMFARRHRPGWVPWGNETRALEAR